MSSQQLFFEFHQAIAYLESYKARGFLISRSKAEIHLNVLRRTGPVADPVLAKMLERILSIHTEIDAIPLQIIEKFRTDLHALALDRGWKHSPQWHWEVTQCSDK